MFRNANKGGTAQALLRPLGRERLFFVGGRKRGVRMNLNAEMVPGIALLLAGAVMTFFADGLCRKKQNVPQMKMLGVVIAVAGAMLVFIP